MSAAAVMERIAGAKLHLYRDGDELTLEPKGLIPADLLEQVRRHKAELLELAPPVPEAARFKTVTARDLMRREFPPVRWAVPELIPEGLILLVGKPKLGKSWLALALALGIASGGRVLGQTKVERGAVLFAGLEDTTRRLQSRLTKVLGEDEEPPEGLELVTTLPRLDEGGLEWVRAWLEAHPDARLVVLDTFARVRPKRRGNTNAYDDDTAALAPLQRLAIEKGVAVVLVHHARKAAGEDVFDSVNGSTGLAGVADASLILGRRRGGVGAVLNVTGRDVEERELPLEFSPSAGTWAVAEGVQVQTVSPERQAILSLLATAGPLKPKEVADRLGKSPNAVRVALFAMRDAGQVRRLEDGRYNPTNTANAANGSEEGASQTREAECEAISGAISTPGAPNAPANGTSDPSPRVERRGADPISGISGVSGRVGAPDWPARRGGGS